jgi:hypothetical protein
MHFILGTAAFYVCSVYICVEVTIFELRLTPWQMPRTGFQPKTLGEKNDCFCTKYVLLVLAKFGS